MEMSVLMGYARRSTFRRLFPMLLNKVILIITLAEAPIGTSIREKRETPGGEREFLSLTNGSRWKI